jgi:hypothetical protein
MTELSPDVAIAWIRKPLRPRVEGSGVRLGEVLPDYFERYLRVFHHFENDAGQWTTWSERAKAARVQFHAQLSERALGRVIMGPWSDSPWYACEGWLDAWSRRAVSEILDSWAGGTEVSMYWGISEQVHGDSTLLLRRRPAALSTAQTRPVLGCELYAGPEYVWPDDRSWVLCTDYDLTSTYIACDESLASAFLTSPDLEVLPTDPNDRVDYQMDVINGGPDGLSLGPALV